ncbi:replication protein RepA [Edaphobacter modestus]|uniref:RepA protein n=1 Tax=Edaphobacter modestus TaxID=388466 RepID=A0A4Q7XZ35_9BACT|nr:replication protein RepA [Edaphobacter modestus]RZU29640.1 RepA protein [Edaphobacter modestus]
MRKPPKNTQEILPGYSDYRLEREKAAKNQVEKLMGIWKAGLSGDKLFTAQMLIYCGLPINKTDASYVVRRSRLADGSSVKVTFSRTNPDVPLPFRTDRTMAYFLTNKAVLQQSPLLRWGHANEYMRLFGLNPDSGYHYKSVQERFTRIAYLGITVEYLDVNQKIVEHWKCPIIDNARITAEVDEEGKWKPSISIAEMLAAKQEVTFGLRFFMELQKQPVPIPIELLIATQKSHRLMDYVVFLYWRAFAGATQSFIPWRYLQEQFDNSDSNQDRWAQQFRKAKTILKTLPDPINQIRFDVSSSGLTIYPLPVGTSFFAGFPKLGSRKALEASGSSS